jgi:hypothetical protein
LQTRKNKKTPQQKPTLFNKNQPYLSMRNARCASITNKPDSKRETKKEAGFADHYLT